MKKKLKGAVIALVAVCVIAVGGYIAVQKVFPDVEFVRPKDGQGTGVTAIGDYAAEPNPDQVVAQIGDATLTNGELQVYYWAEIAAHRQRDVVQPDLRLPLSMQKCPVDDTVNSWEQYFLGKALEAWHGAQALVLQGEDEGLPIDPLYAPDEKLHEKLLKDKPATAYLYGYHDSYQLNTLHKTYIEQLPALFQALAEEHGYDNADALALAVFGTDADSVYRGAEVYNRGYSYYTALTYLVEKEDVPVAAGDEPCVSFRQLLLVPNDAIVAENGAVSCTEQAWLNCEKEARQLLSSWANYFICTEGMFGQMAFTYSQDEASRGLGGYYEDVVRGQVPSVLEGWLFDGQRTVGDTTIVRSEYGVHILYFSEAGSVQQREKQAEAMQQKQLELLESAKAKYPMSVNFEEISLQKGSGEVSYDDFLYHDIAHERYPEMPLYLQNDYGDFLYGQYPMTTHGCGICSLSMVASYVTDTEWRPTVMSDKFSRYNRFVGTDVTLFYQALAEVDYYYVGAVYNRDEAWRLLQDGYPLIVRERNGYWTQGSGHYITVEKINEDGKVVVRDSSLLNFGRLAGHGADAFDWSEVTRTAAVYLVFGKKVIHNDACIRCGDPDLKTTQLIGDSYICPKCDDAILRRTTYLLGA